MLLCSDFPSLGSENQKIVHVVRLDEIGLFNQAISGFAGFLNDYIFVDSVIFAVAVAIDDPDTSARPEALPEVRQQLHGTRHFMVGLQEQHRIDAVRG